MTGIIAALCAHDDIRLFREYINDLPLSFIAPLGTDENCVGHNRIELCPGFSQPPVNRNLQQKSPNGSFGAKCRVFAG